MLVHRGPNPLLVRRNEEMPRVLVAKRLIQPHALAGICSGNDPGCNCPHLHARIPFSLLLDAKSPAWAGSDTFDVNVGLGISKATHNPRTVVPSPARLSRRTQKQNNEFMAKPVVNFITDPFKWFFAIPSDLCQINVVSAAFVVSK